MRQMKNGYIKAFGLLGAIAALYLILLTESRASLLGIFAGVAIYVWLLLPRFLKKWSIRFGRQRRELWSVNPGYPAWSFFKPKGFYFRNFFIGPLVFFRLSFQGVRRPFLLRWNQFPGS